MKHHCTCVLVLLVVVQATSGQIVPNPSDPFEFVAWGMTLANVRQEVLVDPPLALSRHAKTGKVIENDGHFFFHRSERAFGMSVSASYAFTIKDSLLRYVLITAIESDRIKGSVKGTIDTLWHRIARRYGTTKESRELGVLTKREWRWGNTSIVCYRSDESFRSLTLSLASNMED